jgi:hypothetical protein
MREDISTPFLSHAADVLAPGLSGSQIVLITSAYAVDYNVDLPHATYPFQASNKRTALFENLRPFAPNQQYQLIRELCDRVTSEGENPKVAEVIAQEQDSGFREGPSGERCRSFYRKNPSSFQPTGDCT